MCDVSVQQLWAITQISVSTNQQKYYAMSEEIIWLADGLSFRAKVEIF